MSPIVASLSPNVKKPLSFLTFHFQQNGKRRPHWHPCFMETDDELRKSS
jgi:hypothetical protein